MADTVARFVLGLPARAALIGLGVLGLLILLALLVCMYGGTGTRVLAVPTATAVAVGAAHG